MKQEHNEEKKMNKPVTFDAVVIDTETAAIHDNAVLFTISAFKFQLDDLETIPRDTDKIPPHQCLHLYPSVTEQLLIGREVDKGTIAWWNKQDTAAKESLFLAQNSRLADTVAALRTFIGDCQVFCRGTDFDPPKINSLIRQLDLKPIWKYNEVRDVRTYIDALTAGRKGYIENWETPEWIVPHNSLHDCIRDAMQMQDAKSR